MRRRGVSSASVIVFALAIVMMTTVAAYLSVSAFSNTFTARRNLEELYDRGKHEVRATLMPGIPPGWSPKAYLLIHEDSGEGDTLLDILVDRMGSVTSARINEVFDAGACRIIRLERLGLPRSINGYANTSIVIHFSSGAVGKAYQRSWVEPDEVYPCGRDPPERPGVYTVNIRVLLETGSGRQVCGSCSSAVNPPPGNRNYSPYEIARIEAEPAITIGNTQYVFKHWEVSFTGYRDTVTYGLNPLNLLMDDHYFVEAVYVPP
ncbi:MAG: hypothetical protein QXU44_02585 [Candidatus Caldarchaeum sp.]